MKTIPLYKGRRLPPSLSGYFALVDDDSYDYLISFSPWFLTVAKPGYYYVAKRFGREVIRMQDLVIGHDKGEIVDHVDHNGLNNQKSNLRLATNTQNAMNCRIRSDNTTGYKGVCFHPSTGRYRARIKVNGAYVSLGLFDKLEDAGQAYSDAAKLYFGSFAFADKR